MHSEEFKAHPELFTSQTLARGKIEEIRALLNLPYWNDDRFKRLLTPLIVANSGSMLKKLPVELKIAEKYHIDEYLNSKFLILSPSQNYALINYLLDNNMPLVVNEKLSSIFNFNPGALKLKFGIDLKELMRKYKFNEQDLNEEMEEQAKNEIR